VAQIRGAAKSVAIVMRNTRKSKLGAAFHGIFILNCKLLRFYLQENTQRDAF
jgi:hypothetical protein